MDSHEKTLSILQLAVPADTPLTLASEVQVLDLLGLVKNPQSVAAMKMAAALVPPDTPATLRGFLHLMSQLLHLSDRAKAEHHSTMSDVIATLDGVPDETLTFGTFLALCKSLMASAAKHRPER